MIGLLDDDTILLHTIHVPRWGIAVAATPNLLPSPKCLGLSTHVVWASAPVSMAPGTACLLSAWATARQIRWAEKINTRRPCMHVLPPILASSDPPLSQTHIFVSWKK